MSDAPQPGPGATDGGQAEQPPATGWSRGPLRAAALAVLAVAAIVLVAGALRSRTDGTAVPAAPPSARGGEALQYVALGDSLSRGVQPAPGGNRTTASGYPWRLTALLRERGLSVELVEAGCGGATTRTFVAGGRCAPESPVPYANRDEATGQLRWAVERLRDRGGAPTLVTLDVGGNDLVACASPDRTRVAACLRDLRPALLRGWRRIARDLAAVAGPDTVLAVATLYDPFVALLRTGRALAPAVRELDRFVVRDANPALRRIFRAQGWLVADVGAAIGTRGALGSARSRRVRAVCDVTWMCAAQDIHLNDDGYLRAARVFDRATRRSLDALGLAGRP